MPALATRPLGDSPIQASVVGPGCNNFGRRVDLAGTRAILDAAIERGVTFLDTADVYGPSGASEELMGQALQGRVTRSSSPPSSARTCTLTIRCHAVHANTSIMRSTPRWAG